MKNRMSTRSSCLLSIAEAAWLLGVDNSRVCRAIRTGTLPTVRHGRRLLIPAQALAHLADADRASTDQGAEVGCGDAR